MGRGGWEGGYYSSTLLAVSLSASLSPHLSLFSSSVLRLTCSLHSTLVRPACVAAVAPVLSTLPCAQAIGREPGNHARTAFAAFFCLDQTVPVWPPSHAFALAQGLTLP